jgi:hypothetical protein
MSSFFDDKMMPKKYGQKCPKILKKIYAHKIKKVKIFPYHNFSFQCGKDFSRISKWVFENGQK